MNPLSMTAFSFMALLGLSGCTAVDWNKLEVPTYGGTLKPSPGFDPERPEGRRVRLVYSDNLEVINPYFEPTKAQREYTDRGLVEARAGTDKDGNCLVMIRPPKGPDDAAFFYMLGHEAFHCFAGLYHDGVAYSGAFGGEKRLITAGADVNP
jgi:hypothetical protein